MKIKNEDTKMKWKTTTNITKISSKILSSEVTSLGDFDLRFLKNDYRLLILPLYLILFFIWYRFQHLIKIMGDVGDILNHDELFGDIVDTPKKGIEKHKNDPINWPSPGLKCINKMIDLFKNASQYEPYRLGDITDHFKTQETCDKAFILGPWSWSLSLITLRPKKCVKRLLK